MRIARLTPLRIMHIDWTALGQGTMTASDPKRTLAGQIGGSMSSFVVAFAVPLALALLGLLARPNARREADAYIVEFSVGFRAMTWVFVGLAVAIRAENNRMCWWDETVRSSSRTI